MRLAGEALVRLVRHMHGGVRARLRNSTGPCSSDILRARWQEITASATGPKGCLVFESVGDNFQKLPLKAHLEV